MTLQLSYLHILERLLINPVAEISWPGEHKVRQGLKVWAWESGLGEGAREKKMYGQGSGCAGCRGEGGEGSNAK